MAGEDVSALFSASSSIRMFFYLILACVNPTYCSSLPSSFLESPH